MYRYIKIKFTKGYDGEGFMEIGSNEICVRITDDEGSNVLSSHIEYHIIEDNPTQPLWAKEEIIQVIE